MYFLLYNLNNQQLTPQLRGKMIDWMVEVINSYKCDDETFFMSVLLLDLYYANCQQNLETSELHLIGMTCMFMATKYQEIFPIKLYSFEKKIGHQKFQKQQIKNKEYQIIQILNYQISNPTINQFINIMTDILKIKEILNNDMFIEFETFCSYVGKMVLFDYDLMNQYYFNDISAVIINLGLKLINHKLKNQEINDEKFQELLTISQIKEEKLQVQTLNIIQWLKCYQDQFGCKYLNLQKFCQFNYQNLDIIQQL